MRPVAAAANALATTAFTVAAFWLAAIFSSSAFANAPDPWLSSSGVRDSLERLIEDADVIVQATVITHVSLSWIVPHTGADDPTMLALRVTRTFKGTIPPYPGIYIEDGSRCPFGSRQVLFLKRRPGARIPFGVRDDTAGWPDAFPVGLDDQDFTAFTFTAAGDVIQGGGAMAIELERQVPLARADPAGPTITVYRNGDTDGPLSPRFRIVIPLDARAEQLAKRWVTSPDPPVRLSGARVLLTSDARANLPSLLPLLHDPFHFGQGEGKAHVRTYPLRMEVSTGLQARGLPVPKTVLAEPADSYGPANPRLLLLALGLPLSVWITLKVPLWRKTPRDAPWRFAALHGTSGLCAALAALIAAFWIRSFTVVDQYAFGTNPRWELCCAGGTLRLTHLPQWPGPPAHGFARFDYGADTDELWHTTPYRDRRPAHAVLGFGAVHGDWVASPSFIRPGVPLIYTQTTLLAPLPALFAACLIPPAVRLAALALRRRARRRSRRCLDCGYDLRASPGACPECGFAPRRRPSWRERITRREAEVHRAHEATHVDPAQAAALLDQVTD